MTSAAAPLTLQQALAKWFVATITMTAQFRRVEKMLEDQPMPRSAEGYEKAQLWLHRLEIYQVSLTSSTWILRHSTSF